MKAKIFSFEKCKELSTDSGKREIIPGFLTITEYAGGEHDSILGHHPVKGMSKDLCGRIVPIRKNMNQYEVSQGYPYKLDDRRVPWAIPDWIIEEIIPEESEEENAEPTE